LTQTARLQLHHDLTNRIGILSLTETATNALMWAHYADNHKGFVIEFDEANSFFHSQRSAVDEYWHVRPVSYSSTSGVANIITELDGKKVLCTKGAEWAYEKEWRMLIELDGVIPLSTTGELIYLIEFPRDAIQSIIFGARASEELKASIRQVLLNTVIGTTVSFQQATLGFSNREIAVVPT